MEDGEPVKGYGEGYGTGLPNDFDYAEIELRVLKWLNEQA